MLFSEKWPLTKSLLLGRYAFKNGMAATNVRRVFVVEQTGDELPKIRKDFREVFLWDSINDIGLVN